MKLVKEKFRFVFCTLHALMRWAKKEKDTKSIKDRLQLFFFFLFFFPWPPFVINGAFFMNQYSGLHENNLSWK